ncbi:MAG: tetratricopeptide repeat protein [Pseudomonadota bacterium]
MPAASADPRAARRAAADAALSAAYSAVRAAPKDAEARLRLAASLLPRRRPDLVQRHAERAAALAPEDWAEAPRLGDILFKSGGFETAARVLSGVLQRDPNEVGALRTLSAFLSAQDEPERARAFLIRAARRDPYQAAGRIERAKPTILRVRAVENSWYGILRDKGTGLYKRRMKGGHLSVKALIEKPEFNLIVANLAGDVLPPVEGLPPVDVIVNTVACPDLAGASLVNVGRYIERFPGVPVINRPETVLETTRAKNAERLGALEGVRFPRTEALTNDAPPKEMLPRVEALGLGYPLILRVAGTQTGETLALLPDRDEVRDYIEEAEPGAKLYAIEYIDCRGRTGFFHKTRAFFIDGTFHAVANLTSDDWQIHSGDRYRVMSTNAATRREEKRYLANPERYLGQDAYAALHRVRDAIGLDFFGIDFTVTPAGELVIFEANAAMRHNYDHAGAFPYTRPHLDRISAAFNRMVHARAKARHLARAG